MFEDEISEEELVESIAKWHPSEKERSVIELAELEFKTLREAIMGKSKHGHWQGLRRRADFADEQCGVSMEEAQGFLRDLQKSLAATERECSKRMENIQKGCLHRDIQIQTLLDQQILQIVQENKTLQLGEQDLKPLLMVCATIQERVKTERQSLQELVLSCRLEVEDMRRESRIKMKQIKKSHEAKMGVLRERLKQGEKTYSSQLTQLKERRETFQSRILAHIQKQIAYR